MFKVAIIKESKGCKDKTVIEQTDTVIFDRLCQLQKAHLENIHKEKLAKWEERTVIIRGKKPQDVFTQEEISEANNAAFSGVINELKKQMIRFV